MNTDRPPDLSGDMSTGEWSPEAMRAREERRVIAAARRYECLRCGRAIIGTAYEGCHANLLICEVTNKRDERV